MSISYALDSQARQLVDSSQTSPQSHTNESPSESEKSNTSSHDSSTNLSIGVRVGRPRSRSYDSASSTVKESWMATLVRISDAEAIVGTK